MKNGVRYANTLRTLGDYKEAESEYRAVLERNPKQIEAWANLAAIQVARGQKGAARGSLSSKTQVTEKTKWT